MILRHAALAPMLAFALTATPAPAEPPPVPEGMVYYAPGPTGAAVLVPERFARESIAITACESTIDDQGREAWDSEGDNGDSLGVFKVNKVHRARMAGLGLDYDYEADRIYYAAWVLQPEQGWNPWWHCSGKAGLRMP